jgi:Flp pilus assembly protein TadG
MAITLPFLLLLMLSIAELGRILFQSNMLTQASRDAARYLAGEAIAGSTGVIQIDAALATETRNLLVYGNTAGAGAAMLPHLEAGDVTVSSPDAVHVTVTVSYPYRSLLGAVLPDFGLGDGDILLDFPLRATTTMRAL